MLNEVLTTKGEQLFARCLSGEVGITFTKMIIGDGSVNPNLIKGLNAVVSPKATLDIERVTKNADNSVVIKSVFSNQNLDSGFYYREKGIYATDGTTEILFMYGNKGSLAEWITPSTSSLIEKTLSSVIAFSESDQVNITLQSGLYASQADLDETNNILDTLVNEGVPANGGDADTVNGYTIESNVPAGAKFTDTVYTHPNDANTRHVTDAEKTAWNAKAPTASPVFTGIAKATANADYTTPQLRNIQASTADLAPGTSSLANGSIYIVYE